ncbi:MAG: MBL fold metallo-hydrolase RNA specificity domain-containing protein [Candidatus Diapherotrites archaeon]|nr:MBL fold metallo-hydrolase RNA specificity domain-containing protein [Candidatus Diapherotrites archaeon]
MSVQLTGLGGCREVGRSSFLLDIGEKIVLDRGIKISQEETQYPLPIRTNIDAAIVSHAHLDHSGDLPNLFLKSNALCYMTAPTLDIAEILWHDTLKIAGFEGIDASFSKDEIERTKRYTFPMPFRKQLPITTHASLELFDAGHILGSALARLDFGNKSLLYTGDFRASDTRLHNSADLKTGDVNYVVTESTYGDRDHPSREETEKNFIKKVNEGLENGGTVLVPAFAVGRAQEMVDILVDYKIEVPIYLDGMCQKVSTVSLKYPTFFRDYESLKKALHQTVWIRKEQDRKKALRQPSVIIATAGMLAGGPAQYYVKQIHGDENSKILLTGFQVEGTPGHELKTTGHITLDEKIYKVDCEVQSFDFSAHSDKKELFKSFNKWNPEKVVMVHGDEKVMGEFKKTIEADLGIPAFALEAGKALKLD